MPEMGKQFAHATIALSLLPGQFQESTDLRALVSALVGETHGVQECENTLWDLHSMRWLWIATGQQLDGLGDVLGWPRDSDDDDEYRESLYLAVLINVSEGEPERVIEGVETITRASEVHFIEKYDATFVVYAHALERWDLIYLVGRIAPGGVQTVVVGSESANPFVFGVDRDASGTAAGAELSYGTGWGESGAGNTAEGGLITELFYQE